MMKSTALLFGLFVVLGAQTVFSDVGDDDSDVVPFVATERQVELPAALPASISTVADTADADDDNDNNSAVSSGPAESCLFSIYRGAPAPVNESADIVVTAYDFDTDFYTASNLGGSTPGYSFFLSHNNMMSTSASFNILDTTGGLNKLWDCSRSKRLRRGVSDAAYDALNDDDAGDAAKTSAEVSKHDQWGSRANGGEKAIDGDDRSAVYFVRAGTKTFRVSCSVENGFMGIHKNKDCRANVVNGGTAAQANVKVCEASQDDSTDFIEKALRRRDRYLEHHSPTSREGWVRLRDGYNAMKQNCSPLISSDHGAKDALHDLGQEINGKLAGYNKNNHGPSSVEPVVVSGR